MDDYELIDTSALERLRRMGGDEFLNELIDLFLSHTPAKVTEALAGSNEGDWNRVERAVHALKSSAGNLGALPLQELAGRIEQLAEEKKGETIPELLAKLQELYKNTRNHLEALKKGTAS